MITMREILELAEKSLLAERAKLERRKTRAAEGMHEGATGARETYLNLVEEIENVNLKVDEIHELRGF